MGPRRRSHRSRFGDSTCTAGTSPLIRPEPASHHMRLAPTHSLTGTYALRAARWRVVQIACTRTAHRKRILSGELQHQEVRRRVIRRGERASRSDSRIGCGLNRPGGGVWRLCLERERCEAPVVQIVANRNIAWRGILAAVLVEAELHHSMTGRLEGHREPVVVPLT